MFDFKAVTILSVLVATVVAAPQNNRRPAQKPFQQQQQQQQPQQPQFTTRFNPNDGQQGNQQDYSQQQQQQSDQSQQRVNNNNFDQSRSSNNNFDQSRSNNNNLADRRETTTFIPIIRFDNEHTIQGGYRTLWETGNNILAEEVGTLKSFGNDKDNTEAVVQQGSYSYTSPEGQVINVQYTADENGFRATGDHIPTPPPIPAEIQKGLDLIYSGIRQQQNQPSNKNQQQYQDEGQYNDQQYNQNNNQQQQYNQNNNQQQQYNQQQQNNQSGRQQQQNNGQNISFRPTANRNNVKG